MDLKTWVDLERGRAIALAKAIGAPPSFVSKMASGEKLVPVAQCVPIERFTEGVVTCEELRPDKAEDFAYLRGASAAEPSGTQPAPLAVASPDPALGRAIVEAAKAGLIERRSAVRRAEDRKRLGLEA